VKITSYRVTRVITATNGKHYRVGVKSEACGSRTSSCGGPPGLHVHITAALLDALPITHRGMVTWPTRRRRRRRP
jgi:hypothetical protein